MPQIIQIILRFNNLILSKGKIHTGLLKEYQNWQIVVKIGTNVITIFQMFTLSETVG